MNIVTRWSLGLICSFFTSHALSLPICNPDSLAKNPHAILRCYMALNDTTEPLWTIDQDEHDKRGLSIETYKLVSQRWPQPINENTTSWKHHLVIYRPDVIQSHEALLFVNGGTPQRLTKNDPQPFKIDFARIALTTHSVVVDLQDVPEQYLTLGTNHLNEDALVAYTWQEYLKNPATHAYWPLQIPMAKAVVKAMDATQQIIQQEDHFNINHFVVSGISKRGWATWLAALADNRVNAIVPIVSNVLNLHDLLDVTYSSYQQHWPSAFQPYVAQHIPEQIHAKNFDTLIHVIDPLTYRDDPVYKTRFYIPKYIINASGDDFFIPDSLGLYLRRLPGENTVRVLPNESHAVSAKVIENALLAYYETIIYQIARPQLHTALDSAGQLQKVSLNEVASNVILWQAENKTARDFRYNEKVVYHATKLLASACQGTHCDYTPQIAAPKNGWKSYFVEAVYDFTNGDRFVLTSPAFVEAVPAPKPITKAAPLISTQKMEGKHISCQTHKNSSHNWLTLSPLAKKLSHNVPSKHSLSTPLKTILSASKLKATHPA